MPDHFSLSQARLALSCPLAWRLRYHDGLRGAEMGLAASQGLDMDNLLNCHFGGGVASYSDDEAYSDYLAILDYVGDTLDGGRPQVEIHKNVDGIPLPILGYADLVTPLCVWDWKRGGGWDEAWWDSARRQVALYADALDLDKGGIVQVKDGRVRTREFDITPELVASVHDELRRGWEATTKPATPGKACGWCDYESYCDMSVFK